MKDSTLHHLIWLPFYLIICLGIFGIGLLMWSSLFGIPCWTFNGGMINDTATREIIERCTK